MISAYERADLIHILKMKNFTLHTEDAGLLLFTKNSDEADSSVTINIADNQPVMQIERHGTIVFSGTFKSVDDLKIFLEVASSQQYLN